MTSLAKQGWPYYAQITISNSNNNTLTDYQVRIDLNENNFDFEKAKKDGSDIRFTLTDEETQLSYWIEEWNYCNKKATIWLKVPSIPASSSAVIYLWCGNEAATSQSNGQDVFDYFNNFNGQEFSEGQTVCNVSNKQTLYGKIIHIKSEPGSSGHGQFALFVDDSHCCLVYPNSNVLVYDSDTHTIASNVSLPVIIELKPIDSNQCNYNVIGYDSAILGYNSSTGTPGDLVIKTDNSYDITTKIYEVFVRKSADQEPTISIGELSVYAYGYIQSTLVKINIQQVIDTFTGDGSTTSFTTTKKPLISKVRVFLNDAEHVEGADFTVDYQNGTITFNSTPSKGDTIKVVYYNGELDFISNVMIKAYINDVIATTKTDQYGNYTIKIPKYTEVKIRAETDETDSITVVKLTD